MKHLKVSIIAGGDDGYTEVTGGGRYPKWDFKTAPELECVIMDRKTFPQQKGGGTYDLYTVIEKNTKKPFAIFTTKVLEDKLKNIPTFSLVKIKFEGAHATKKYYLYKVLTNSNFRFDPQQFSLDNYQEVKDGAQSENAVSSAPVKTNYTAPATSQVDDDLPF